MWGGSFTFAQMEKKNGLNSLRRITLILLVVYMLFTLMNFLKGVWNFAFHFNYGELKSSDKISKLCGEIPFSGICFRLPPGNCFHAYFESFCKEERNRKRVPCFNRFALFSAIGKLFPVFYAQKEIEQTTF